MILLIACKVVHSPQVTGARSHRAATCTVSSCVHEPGHACACMCVFVAMNLNTLPIIPFGQGHLGVNPGIWDI